MKNIGLILFLILCISCISCNNGDIYKEDNLSFSGITMGQEFPDSLKSSFEFSNEDIPYYEGHIPFEFPNSGNANLSVVAVTNMEGTEVICIQIGNMDLEQSEDFYDMLKSKYGLPVSEYGSTDIKLKKMLNNIFEDLGYKYYGDKVDVSGKRVLAVWYSVKGNTDIIMIGNTYHSPNSYSDNEPWTYVWFKYIDRDKMSLVKRQSENNRIKRERDYYKKKNSKFMEQDF